MYNRLRSLLLNEPSDPYYPYGEEAVPSGYTPRRLAPNTARAYASVFGTARDRASKNWVLGSLAPVLAGRAVTDAVAGTDQRVAYWPATSGLGPPDWSAYGTLAVTGPPGLSVYGTPDFAGPAAVEFGVEAVPGGSVTVTVPNGMARTVTPPYSGGRSAAVALASGVRFTVPASGGSWSVRAISKRPVSLESVYTLLSEYGNTLCDAAGLRPNLDATGHLGERLGVMLAALAAAIEKSAGSSSTVPAYEPVLWPDLSIVYWPDGTPLYWPL